MKRISRFVIFLAAFLTPTACFFPRLSFANLIVVDSTDYAPNPLACTLRQAITSANTDTSVGTCQPGNGPDTILLLDSLYELETDNSEPDGTNNALPQITSPITIDGDEIVGGSQLTVLGSLTRIFAVHGEGNLTLNHISFGGSNVPASRGGGAALIDSGGTATFNFCAIATNFAGFGAAVFVGVDSEATFNDSTLNNNQTVTNGLPAIATGGGAIFNNGTLTLHHSQVVDNKTDPIADSGFGGGIVNNGIATLDSTEVSHNQSDLFGAGIYNNGQLVVHQGTFDTNILITTSGLGGGIYNSPNGNLQIDKNTVLSRNAGNQGGGIYNDRGVVDIQNSTFFHNTTSNQNGGGLFNQDGGVVSLSNTSFSSNLASNGGGGIFNQGILSIKNCAFLLNAANHASGGSGSAIVNSGADAQLSTINSTFSGQNMFNDPLFAFQNIGGHADIRNSTFEGNTGWALFSSNVGGIWVQNTILSNSSQSNCTSTLFVTSKGYNLDTDGSCGFSATGDQNNLTADLGPLQDNGGPTQTHALLPGSAAIDHGDPSGCKDPDGHLLTTDQRGFSRPLDGDGNGSAICDVGAFEVNPHCGDGILDPEEQCDDGRNDDGDGCNSSCAIEPGYSCAGQPSGCTPGCGDGVIAGSEQCDDGNSSSGDGCSKFCTVEPGYVCEGTPSHCHTVCGDGIIAGSEQCDDGNLKNLDGCDFQCHIEPRFACTGQPSVCTPGCGDGSIDGSEQCDDDNLNDGDGCSSTCTIEAGFTCRGTPSLCSMKTPSGGQGGNGGAETGGGNTGTGTGQGGNVGSESTTGTGNGCALGVDQGRLEPSLGYGFLLLSTASLGWIRIRRAKSRI
jgi:cysteine-rich repeat protein